MQVVLLVHKRHGLTHSLHTPYAGTLYSPALHSVTQIDVFIYK